MTTWRDVPGAETAPAESASVVTIGNFDGVHLGHRHVIDRARSLAASLGDGTPLPVIAVTFDPHPLAILAPEHAPLRLTTLERRIALLREAGADAVRVLAFSADMAAWSPAEFVERVLVDALRARGVVVGENFRFGHKAAGDCGFLREVGLEHGFVVDDLPLDAGGHGAAYSSTLVRALLGDGDVAGAAAVLGRPFTVEGEVRRGDQRGRELGFPTANVPADPQVAVPVDGVYAGWLVRADGERLPAAISVGTNPTFDGTERRVESYVIGRTDLDLYGEHVSVEFVERLRQMVRFDGIEALVAQMHDDVTAAREVLDSPAHTPR